MTRKYDDSGVRMTDCCGAASTFVDGTLCCKKCYCDVRPGEGDFTEFRWNAEHPRASVPNPVTTLLVSGGGLLKDDSWHNDVCPHFSGLLREPKGDVNGFELWVDYENPEDREFPEHERFRIYTTVVEDGYYLDGRETVAETDSLDEAVAWVIANAKGGE